MGFGLSGELLSLPSLLADLIWKGDQSWADLRHIFCFKTLFSTSWFPSDPLSHCPAIESPKSKAQWLKSRHYFSLTRQVLESFSSMWLEPENLKRKKELKSIKLVCGRNSTKYAQATKGCERVWHVLGRDIWAWLKPRMMTRLEATEICRAWRQNALYTQTSSVGSINQGTVSGGPFSNNDQPLSKHSPWCSNSPRRISTWEKHIQMHLWGHSLHHCSKTRRKAIKQNLPNCPSKRDWMGK